MPIFTAFAVSAAEIAAAEIAAAAAAEAAAVAAAEAAATAAAEQAATAAATEAAAAAAAETAAQTGIMEVGGATANAANAAATPLTTAAEVQTAAQGAGQNIAPEVASRGIQGVPDVMSPAQRAYLEASTASVGPGGVPGQSMLPAYPQSGMAQVPPIEAGIPGDISNAGMRYGMDPSFANMPPPSDAMMRAGMDPAFLNGPTPSDAMMRGFTPSGTEIAPKGSLNLNTGQFTNTTLPSAPQGPGYFQQPAVAPGQGPLQLPTNYQLNFPTSSANGLTMPNTQPITSVSQTGLGEPPSSFMKGLDSAIDWAKANKFQAVTGAYMGANMLGLNKPSGSGGSVEEYDGPLKNYRLSPDFKGSTANPVNFQYTPRYAMGGGIMGSGAYDIPVGYDEGGDVPEYAKGGSLSESIEQYQKMLDGKPREALPVSRDVGIYYDQDPDTRYQDALTAAQIRQAKVNKRANVDLPGMKRPTPMGQLNLRPAGVKAGASGSSLDPENAASGGIMHSSLGGYAAGGNPRLLRGPGDGMSDNIPATISGRQPARLADGEFVIPADVVSHLGNGSTEAGAKQLHAMMDKVRKARTGNPKQGKNIKPQKYMPKTRA
jgi:hypothetical protein